VFTAANEIYAKQILRKIDPEGKIFDFELFRQHCDVIGGKLAVKDLRILSNRSIKNVILVDNSPHTYLYQKENAVPIVSFHDDLGDT
jgi:TFIIF-interacting CTD phosphatase-like protein